MGIITRKKANNISEHIKINLGILILFLSILFYVEQFWGNNYSLKIKMSFYEQNQPCKLHG